MGQRTGSYLIRQFFLPLICLSLIISLSFFCGRNEQVRFGEISTLLQNLESLEFSLVQIREAASSDDIAVPALQMNGLEYSLKVITDRLTGNDKRSKEEEAILLRLQNYYQELNSLTGKAGERTQMFTEVTTKLEKDFSQDAFYIAGLSERMGRAEKGMKWLFYTAQAGLFLLLIYIVFFFYIRVWKALRVLESKTRALADGNEDISPEKDMNVLFGAAQSGLREHQSHLHQLSRLAEQIGEGNFNQKEEEFENAGALGRSIGLMREKIQASFQDEEKRRWANEGIARFSGLVREHSQDPDMLCPKILTELIPFTGTSQGGIFLAEKSGNETELHLRASYAWGRQKHENKSYLIGEGLIGQAALDREMIFLNDVPDDFITISSGLGEANPGCILILPLVAGEQLHGVMELASFTIIEEYKIVFLQKLCEILASAIAMANGNLVTRQLLQTAEEANLQLKAQEEELRQNTEEMMSTQEAMMRKEAELSGLFASINYNMFTAEIDQEGLFSQLNEKFTLLLGGHEEDYVARPVCEVLQVPEWVKMDYENFLAEVRKGMARNVECRLTGNNKIWFSASFTPVKNKEGKPMKIMLLAHDITEKKEAEEIFKIQAKEIKHQEEQLRIYTTELESLQADLESRLKEATREMERQIQEIESEKTKNGAILEGCVDGVISFNESGRIEYFNKAAEDIWEISREEAFEKRIEDFIPVEIMMVDDELLVYYSKNGGRKILDTRTEVPVNGKAGQEMEVLLTLTRVKVEGAYTFTAFAQKVAVELF